MNTENFVGGVLVEALLFFPLFYMNSSSFLLLSFLSQGISVGIVAIVLTAMYELWNTDVRGFIAGLSTVAGMLSCFIVLKQIF